MIMQVCSRLNMGLKCYCPRTDPESISSPWVFLPLTLSMSAVGLSYSLSLLIHSFGFCISSLLSLSFPSPCMYMDVKCNSVDILLMDGKRHSWSKKMKRLEAVWFPLVFDGRTESPQSLQTSHNQPETLTVFSCYCTAALSDVQYDIRQ